MPDGGYIVTRFAPSPTGHLHVGGARTALFCWAFAKTQRDAKGRPGRFMIRIEDTDQARSSDESARGILEDLAWLGIDWDDGPVLTEKATGNGQQTAGGGGQERTIGGDERGVGPFFQARRVDLYNQQIERLVRLGRAYPAFEGSEELEVKRKAAAAAKLTYRYQRPADVKLGEFNAGRWRRAQGGETHVIRFAAPHEEVVVHDQVLGDVKYAAGEMDDFVIRKADGFPTYHFAVVVDDELMGVTHVLRAQEHLNNTPRHVALQRALEFRSPAYAHMPLIFNMDGTKMSKRDKAKAARQALQQRMSQDKALTAASLATTLGLEAPLVTGFLAKENDSLDMAEKIAHAFGVALPEVEVCDFREAGYVPEAMTNFLALLGWNPGMKLEDGKDLEKFDTAFLAKHFSLDRIGKTNAKFDRKKLLSFNGDYIVAMPDEEFGRRWSAWLGEYGPADLAGKFTAALDRAEPWVGWLVRAIKPRAKTFRDGLKACEFLMRADDAPFSDRGAIEKHLLAGGSSGLNLLRGIRERLGSHQDWSPEALNAMLEAFTTERGLSNMGAVAQPLRVALTGTAVSPPLGETLAVLGRESSLRRIDRCLSQVV